MKRLSTTAKVVLLAAVGICLAWGAVWAGPAATVTASSYENDGGNVNPPGNAYDGSLETRWSAWGVGEWIQFAFVQPQAVDSVSIAFHNGNLRVAAFSIEVSDDGQAWTTLLSAQSSGVTTGFETFAFPRAATAFIRIVGGGNSDNEWNSYAEVDWTDSTLATCNDGIQNQDETGIDCGGSCDPCPEGTTFYVANDGDDANDGTSPDTPWKTIDHVNEQDFAPGDAVRFKRGDTWREQLTIQWSGTPQAYITFGAYGEGDRPRILGSERAADWSQVDGHPNIWQSATALDAPFDGHPASIFFGETDGSTTWGRVQNITSTNVCGSEFSLLTEEYDWCYDGSLYVHADQDPGTRYAFVEVPQRRGAITMVGHAPEEYIAIDGLEMMYGTMYGYNDGWPMDYEVRGLTVTDCHIGYIGVRGSASAMGLVIWHSDMLVRDNDIHDCGRRSISYNVYTDNGRSHEDLVFENVLFENNTLHHGFHTTGFDISHGTALFDTFRNFTFRNNFIYDDPADDPTDAPNDFTSMGLYLEPGSGLFTDFTVTNNVLKNLKQKGLAIGGVHNLTVANNVIYGMNPNIGDYRPMVSISGDYQNASFTNNIVYGTVSRDLFLSRCVTIGGSDTSQIYLDHNLYFQVDPDQQIINTPTGSYKMSAWTQYQADMSWDTDSPVPQDPLFVDPAADDFRLQPVSVAVGAGATVGLDYNGAAPDIGARERSSGGQ